MKKEQLLTALHVPLKLLAAWHVALKLLAAWYVPLKLLAAWHVALKLHSHCARLCGKLCLKSHGDLDGSQWKQPQTTSCVRCAAKGGVEMT